MTDPPRGATSREPLASRAGRPKHSRTTELCRSAADVLEQVGGSRTEAAKLLGVPRTTLINKIRRFGLS
ncbi:MAG TPA: helix-turn-helix domain-containing protein [Candidatus Eisenbacteria bacterium]